eukprot:TRINITY_DN2090_c1_g1_i1.p1 TRINITY_DN2090_c1_g1~~TRINITY_DN2090_c1_g1_i1.p1  ORF type:complete len:474 (-),score=92.98 TRINITY_DN2090_c1_g1_i1:146-1567(-)
MSDSFQSFSGFGLKYLNQAAHILAPEGNILVRDWLLMKWWHVLIVVLAYPFILGNLRLHRFEQHQSPFFKYQPVAFFFSVLAVAGYLFVLYEVIVYLFWDTWIAALKEETDDLNHKITIQSETQMKDERIAFVLCFFHVLRLCFDVMNTVQSTLLRTVNELRSEQAINEIRFTLTHFLVWWLTILYYPGSEVLYTVAVVCLFYLGTILCTFSPGKFIKTKMMLWLILVSSNFLKLGSNLWMGSSFPASLLAVSPPYDINNNIHMTIFYFVRGFPLGASFTYLLYGRGNLCSWWIVLVFLFCAHWPIGSSLTVTHTKEKSGGSNRALSAAVKAMINEKQEEVMRKEMEKEKELEKQREKMKEKQKVNNPNHLKKTNGPSKGKLVTSSSHNPLKEPNQSESKVNAKDNQLSNGEFHNTLYRKCSYYLCDHYESQSDTFQVCQRCHSAYCSRECQIKDWASNHKSYCKQFLLIKKP